MVLAERLRLRLLEQHSLEELEAAVLASIERRSPRLETIQVALRRETEELPHDLAVPACREDLLAIEVAEADLSSWAVLHQGGAR